MLNERLTSALRVEIDQVARERQTDQVNLTALAAEIQVALDRLEAATLEELRQPQTSGTEDFRLIWHARRREPGEEADPVII